MNIADELKSVKRSLTIVNCWNGYVVEVEGTNHDDEYKFMQIICKHRTELSDVVNRILDIKPEE